MEPRRKSWMTTRAPMSVLLLFLVPGSATAGPVNTFDNAQFPSSIIATGLNFPYSMAQLGAMVVFGSSQTGFGGPGSLLAASLDGGAVQTLVTGLSGPVTGVRLTNDGQTLVVSHGSDSSRQLSFFDANTHASLGSVNFTYPNAYVHGTGAIGLRSDSNISGATDVFFNVGSEFGDHVGISQVSISGLATAILNQATAYELIFTRTGNTVNISSVSETGSGLRNAFGFAPLTNGDLLITDNADTPGQDELNLVLAGAIGNVVTDFGFDHGCYVDRTGTQVGTCVQPIFSPPYPLAVGATDVAVVPAGFGSLGGGYLIAFHGLQGGPSTQSTVLYWNPSTGQSFPFLPNQIGLGHPDSLLFITRNGHPALVVNDFSQNGLVGGSGTGTGQIILIEVAPVEGVPEPGSAGLLAIGTVALIGFGKRMKRSSQCES